MTEASRHSALLKTWVANYCAKSLTADVHPLSSYTAAVLCISTAPIYACAQLKHRDHTKWSLRPTLSYKSICTLTSESLGDFFPLLLVCQSFDWNKSCRKHLLSLLPISLCKLSLGLLSASCLLQQY